MTAYSIDSLLAEIRVAMDMNSSDAVLTGLGDPETLTLDQLIRSKIADAARVVECAAPMHLIGPGQVFATTITWESAIGYGCGRVLLPTDFMRLVAFQMTDWDYAVTTPISEDSPEYVVQRSRFPGVRGCPQRPVCALVNFPSGLYLEFFSCTEGETVGVRKARYLPMPAIQTVTIGEQSVEQITLCDKLKPSIVYYAAHMTALALGNGEQAAALLQISNSLAQ